MAFIVINREKCDLCGRCAEVCPFKACEIIEGKVEINAACKMCKICIKNCPNAAISITESKEPEIDKSQWKGIMIYVEHHEGVIHPITYELAGKASELAKQINHPVYAVLIGSGVTDVAGDLTEYGIDRVFVYDDIRLKYFKADIYTNVFEDCIRKAKPSVVLVGATPVGRSLAPRLSTRFRTGLTADCTKLEIRPSTDLVQIRPAFGGNIMARIVTKNSRPQFATVRYKVMNAAERIPGFKGVVEQCEITSDKLHSGIEVLEVRRKEKQPDITEADVLVVAGRGLKDKKDIAMLEELAALLGGQIASTRGLVEDGWMHYKKQIGLSGRTVKPKLIITCGVSGAVQFTAGMNGSDTIIAINNDKNAPIFKIAHYGLVGDLYEIIPALIGSIKQEGNKHAI